MNEVFQRARKQGELGQKGVGVLLAKREGNVFFICPPPRLALPSWMLKRVEEEEEEKGAL